MRNRELLPYRERMVSRAEGRVLEVGIGSGMNGRFYSDRVTEVVGIDAHPKLLTMTAREDFRVSAKTDLRNGGRSSAGSTQLRYDRRDLDALFDIQSSSRSARDAPCSQAQRALTIRGARAGAGRTGSLVATAADTRTETARRGMPFGPADLNPDRKCRICDSSSGDRVHARPKTVDLHV